MKFQECLKCGGRIAQGLKGQGQLVKWCYCDRPKKPTANEENVKKLIVKYFGEKALENKSFVRFCMDASIGLGDARNLQGHVPPKPDKKQRKRK